jgi:hypothetical protein
MSNVIPNPKRIVRVNIEQEKVRTAVKVLAKHVQPTKLTIENDIMNYYQFQSATKGLDTGMFLEVCLHKVDNDKTDIHIEVRRVFGHINTIAEIDDAWGFVNGFTNMMGKALRGEIS